MFTDTHLHLNRHEFDPDREAVLERAVAAGVDRYFNIGYDPESSAASAALAAADPRFRAAVGVHPHDAALVAAADGTVGPEGEAVLRGLEELAAGPGVVAWGEIGLDFYRDLSPRPAQYAALREQLRRADALDLPVVFHIRDAYAETLSLLEDAGPPRRRGVLHSFAGDLEDARWAVDHGFVLGIGGPVTYKNSRLPSILAELGPDDVILETDAPWLPPTPHRGRRNEPAYLIRTAEAVAAIFGMSLASLAGAVAANVARIFPRSEAA